MALTVYIIRVVVKLPKHCQNTFFQMYLKAILLELKTKPQINQDDVRLMKDLDEIDMEKTQYSKLLSEIVRVDIVITMRCNVNCPAIPCEYREDWGLSDPSGKNDVELSKGIHSIPTKILELTEKIKKDELISKKI